MRETILVAVMFVAGLVGIVFLAIVQALYITACVVTPVLLIMLLYRELFL